MSSGGVEVRAKQWTGRRAALVFAHHSSVVFRPHYFDLKRPLRMQSTSSAAVIDPAGVPPASAASTPELSLPAPTAYVPSRLGTKMHWDEVYTREGKTFAEIGDEGDIWSAPADSPGCERALTGVRTQVRRVIGRGNGRVDLGKPPYLGFDCRWCAVRLLDAASR